MWGERNCLSFETAIGAIEPPPPRLTVRALPHDHRSPQVVDSANCMLILTVIQVVYSANFHLIITVIQIVDSANFLLMIAVIPGSEFTQIHANNCCISKKQNMKLFSFVKYLGLTLSTAVTLYN